MSGMEPTTLATSTGAAATALDYKEIRDVVVTGGRNMLIRYGIVAPLSLAGTTALVRMLGAADWGIVSVGYFLVVFLDNNFGAMLLGALVQAREEPDPEFVAAAVALMWAVGGAVVLLACAAAAPASLAYGRAALGWALVAVAICGLVYSWRATSLALIERRLDYRTVATAEVLDQVVFYAIAIPAVLLGGGITAALIALALRGMLSALLLRARRPVPRVGSWTRARILSLYRFAAPNLGTSAAILVSGLIPLAVLSARQGRFLGFMMTASTIVGYAATVQVISQRLGFASLSRLSADAGAFRHATQRSLSLSTFVVVALALPLGGAAPIWVPLMFGPSWKPAVTVMAWMASATVLLSVANIATAVLLARRRPGRTLLLNTVATAVYLLASVLLLGFSPRLALPIGWTIARALTAALALGLLLREVGANAVFRTATGLVLAAIAIPLLAAFTTSSPILGTVTVAALLALWSAAHRANLKFLVSRTLS